MDCSRFGCYRGSVRVTIGVGTLSATRAALVLTALATVRWKPSAGSRSLSDISALSAPPARIGVAQATLVASLPASPPRPSSPPGRCLWVRLPDIHRRESLCNPNIPGGLKGRGPLACSLVACAGPILASAERCCCPSENIPRSDRQRSEGFQLSISSAVRSPDPLSSTPRSTETDVKTIP